MSHNKTNYIWALIGSVCFIVFTTLRCFGKLNDLSYCSMIIVLFLVILALIFYPRLKELDLKNLRLTLIEINEAKEEVASKEKEIKEIAKTLARITAFTGQVQNRMLGEGTHELHEEWYRQQIEYLLKVASFTEDDRKDIFRIYDVYNEFDQALNRSEKKFLSQEQREEIRRRCEGKNTQIENTIKSDIEKYKNILKKATQG